MSFPCVYVEKSIQTAVEIYVNYTTQSKLFLGCAAKHTNQLQTTLFIRLTYDIAHHGKYVHRQLFVFYRADQYGGNGHAVRKATSRNVVQFNFFHSLTTSVGLGLFIVDVFKSHWRNMSLGRTPLGEWSELRRDLCVTSHNTHSRQISMRSAWFEPAIPSSQRPLSQALDSAATGRAN